MEMYSSLVVEQVVLVILYTDGIELMIISVLLMGQVLELMQHLTDHFGLLTNLEIFLKEKIIDTFKLMV